MSTLAECKTNLAAVEAEMLKAPKNPDTRNVDVKKKIEGLLTLAQYWTAQINSKSGPRKILIGGIDSDD